jgi:hypothetical protein
MPKCRRCGFELEVDVQYCPKCSTKVDTTPRPADAGASAIEKGSSMSEKASRMRQQIQVGLDAEINASNRRIKKILSAPAVRSTSLESTEFGLTMTCEACGGSGHCSSCREWYQGSTEGNTCPDCSGTGECADCGGDGTVGDE